MPGRACLAVTEFHNIRRFYCDTAFLLVFPRVCEPRLSSFRRSNDARLAHQGVRQRRLAVVNMCYHRHVANIFLLVHDLTDLVNCEVHLKIKKPKLKTKPRYQNPSVNAIITRRYIIWYEAMGVCEGDSDIL